MNFINKSSTRLYSHNLSNRLNELNNPIEEDQIRWPMEMTQNGKDTLFSETNYDHKDKVEISFEVKRDTNTNQYSELIFTHNGPPFNENQLCGLITRISSDKNNDRTTGKFGTGFVTSHVLSKTVYITGDLYENEKTRGFSVTMCREGKTKEELEKNLDIIEKSYRKDLEPFNMTQFRYPIKTDLSRKCLELGLIHYKKNIPNVLINCPSIECIHLIDNKNDDKYSASLKEQINENIYCYKVSCNEKDQYFLVVKDNEVNLDISIEIDAEKYGNDKEIKIVSRDNDKESLFITFPLIGSKAHALPFYINSPNFSPSTERNGLYLNGKEYVDEEKTDSGKNKEILMRSIVLFEKLIHYLKEKKCSNIYELSFGLQPLKMPYKTFDSKWHNNTFLIEIRKVLISEIMVKTFSCKEIPLKDAIFPIKQIDDNMVGQFIKLSLTNKYYPNIISENDCLKWRNRLWETMHYISINDVVDKIQADPSILQEYQMASLNEFISFMSIHCKELLYTIPLVPDMNNQFKRIINDGNYMKKCQTVPDELIDIMESLNIPWMSTHVNKCITSIDIPEDKTNDAENIIIDKMSNDEISCFQIMHYVLENNETMKKMFDLITHLQINNIHWESPIYVTNINQRIWESAYKTVIDKIVQTISTFDQSKIKEEIDMMTIFVSVFYDHYKYDENMINTTKIIPNGNYELKILNDLYNKSDVFHDHFNPIMKQNFKIDFNDLIIHPQINKVIKANKNEEITDFLKIINQKINDFDKEKQIQIAESVIALVPQNDDQTPSLIDQNQIFELYKQLINSDLKKIIINEKDYSFNNWKISNQNILSTICHKIEETKSLEQFKLIFSFDDDSAIDKLNTIYSFENYYKLNSYKIVPNKFGKFMNKSELMSNPDIPDDFYKIISYLEPDSKIEQNIVHSKTKIQNLTNFDVAKFQERVFQVFTDTIDNKNPDIKLFELIRKVTKIYITTPKNSKFDKLRENLLVHAHLYFVKKKNRLLDTPFEEEYQKWAFELASNSVDCIQKDEKIDKIYSKNNGKMKFDFQKNKVIFTHYGSPFTEEDLVSLLYQYGGMKDEDQSKIGRFGTGFLSTLVLSRVVQISGDLISKEGKLSGFEVTIYREGNTTEELNKGIKKMEESKKLDLPLKGKTEFTFILPEDDSSLKKNSVEAYNKGFESLKENIPPILIFNPSIKEITIQKNDEKYTFSRIASNGPIQNVVIFSKEHKLKKYIHFSMKDTFIYEPKKMRKEVGVNCLLELNEEEKIVPAKNCLFIGFPLFGPKKFESSVIFNSFEFEPENERSDIILQFDDKIQESYESAINKFIISKGMELFEQIIKFSIDKGYGNLYNMFNGLVNVSDFSKNQFLTKSFIGKMNEFIMSFHIFETRSGSKKQYNEVMIPFIPDYNAFVDYENHTEDCKIIEKSIYDEFYNLLIDLQTDKKHLVVYDHCSKWISILRYDFPSKFGPIHLFKMLSGLCNISNLPYSGKDTKESFLSKIVIFIEKMKNCNAILNENKILINTYGNFEVKYHFYKFNLPNEYLEMLDIVKFDYQKYILHPELEHLYNNKNVKFCDFGIDIAITSIKNHINPENSIQLMKFVIENNDESESLFWFTKFFHNDLTDMIYIELPVKKTIQNHFMDMFNKAYEYVIEILINEFKNINVKDNIYFVIKFLKFLKKKIPNDRFEKEPLIPNQEYQLLISKDLHKDLIQNENIKDILNEFLDINLRQNLVLDSCSDIVNCEGWNLPNISQMILNAIQNDEAKLFEKDKIELYTIIFQHSLSNIKDLPNIIDLIHFFLNKDITVKIQEDESNCWLPNLTEKVMKMAIEDINKYISTFSNILEIKETEEEINILYEKMPILYSLSVKYECFNKIFPNYFGDLKTIDEIQIIYDSQIENEVLEKLIHYLILLHEPGEVEMTLLNKSIKINDELKKKIKNNFVDLNKLSDDISEGISKWNESKKLKTGHANVFSYNDFVSFINKNEKLKIAFVDKLSNSFKENRFEFTQNLDNFNRLLQTHKVLEEVFSFEITIPDNVLEVPYLIDVIIYELLIKSGKFTEVSWPNLSNEPTDHSVQYCEKTYFIDKKKKNYDIMGIDSNDNHYYFVISSPYSDPMTEEQKKFALNLAKSNEHIIEIKIEKPFKLPFLWFTRQKILI